MNVNMGRKLLLTDLARVARLSRSRFCEAFKSELGLSVGRYLKALRIQRAHELLKTTSLSEKEIGIAVGLADQSHFIRDFKRVYDLTPSQYREQVQDSQTDH